VKQIWCIGDMLSVSHIAISLQQEHGSTIYHGCLLAEDVVKTSEFGDDIRANQGDMGVLTRGEIYGQSGIYKLANFSLRNWDPGIHKLALQMDSGYCLIAKILDSQWSSSDEHRGASSAGYSVAWGQTTFWRDGSVTPRSMGSSCHQSLAHGPNHRPARQQLYKGAACAIGEGHER
jgi:hypothetical protein